MLPLYDNIRRRRIELNMSQQELADKAGYTDRSSIAKIESGKVDLTQSKIIALAKSLKIHPGQLMGWTEPVNQALWRYTTIDDEKIVHKYPGLTDIDKLPNPETQTIKNLLPLTVFNMEGVDGAHTINLNMDNFKEINDLISEVRDMPPEKIQAILQLVKTLK